MNHYIKLWLTTIIVATHFMPVIFLQQSVIAEQSDSLSKLAKAVSVRINTSTEINPVEHTGKGQVFTTQYTSGIIVHRNQDLFSVIAADSIVPETQWITTSDGQSHKVAAVFNYSDVYGQKQLSLVQFRSNKNYPIAKISKTNKLLRRGNKIYIIGITTGADRNPFSDFKIHSGRVTTNRQGSFLYDNIQTVDLPTGGAIFNRYGELVGFHNKNKWSINENEDLRRGYSGYPSISLSSLYLHDDMGEYGLQCGTGRGKRRTIRDKYNSGILINDFSQLTKEINFDFPTEVQTLDNGNTILVEEYIAIAVDMYKNNKIEESIRALNAAIEIEPRNADLYSLRGLVLENTTNSSIEALSDYNRAINLNPNDSLALFMRIKNSQAQNKWPNYESLLRLNPNNEVLYYLRGEFKRSSEDLPGALSEFDRMVAANPKSSRSYLARGLFKEYDLRDFQSALTDYQKLVQLENHPAIYDVMIRLQENKIKDFPGALASYNQAINLGDGPGLYSRFQQRRAQLKQNKLLDFAGALADYNQMISFDPYNLAAYQLRAELKATKLNDLNGALQDYNNLIAFGNGRGNYYLRAEFKIDKLKDIQGALSDFDAAINLDPKEVEGYILKAEFKISKAGDYLGALSDYNQMISIFPENDYLYTLRAKLKSERLNDLTGALEDYARAIEIKPKNDHAYVSRANLKSEKLHDLKGALEDYNLAIKASDTRDNYYLRAAFKADKLHDLIGASSDYDSAIVALDPNFPGLSEAYHKRAEFKIDKVKDFSAALSDYDKSINLFSYESHDTYYLRGVLKLTKMQDRPGAIADFNQYIYHCNNDEIASETCQKNQENIQRYLKE